MECLVLEDPVDEGSEEVPQAVLALPVPVERHDHLHHHRVARHHVGQPVNLEEYFIQWLLQVDTVVYCEFVTLLDLDKTVELVETC